MLILNYALRLNSQCELPLRCVGEKMRAPLLGLAKSMYYNSCLGFDDLFKRNLYHLICKHMDLMGGMSIFPAQEHAQTKLHEETN